MPEPGSSAHSGQGHSGQGHSGRGHSGGACSGRAFSGGITEIDRAAWREWARTRAQDAFLRGREAGAAGDVRASRRWLERARRISDGAVQVDTALALARLADGDAPGAVALLRGLLRRCDFREGWTMLAAAHRVLGDAEAAALALHRALARHAPDPTLGAAMTEIARGAMWPGWCGLLGGGTLLVDGAAWLGHASKARTDTGLEVRLDGVAVADGLPPGWRSGMLLELRRGGGALLGSPIAIDRILRSEGFVEATKGGLYGWLWHPSEPEREPWLTIVGADGSRRRIRLEALAEHVDSDTPLARPRRLQVAWRELPDGPVRLFGDDGRALLGSPVMRLRRTRSRAGAAATRMARPGLDVVIPVYRDLRRTLDCIEGVRATLPRGSRIVVVDDASPEPELSDALDRLAQSGVIVLLRHDENQGFPRSANRGIAACQGGDVILLNSDTLVAPGWTEALRAALDSAPDIGTATPFSNDASILSYPSVRIRNAVPDAAETRRLMALAAHVHGTLAPIEIPTGNGFCMAIRRDCLDQTGPLREDAFAQGYGEENDFCLRARRLGWRHVGVPGAYVGHIGQVSFGAAGRALMARNLRILNRLHPGYDALIEAHVAADPLARARRQLDRLRFADGRFAPARAVLLITHAHGGGVGRVVRARALELRAQGIRPIVLRPDGECCLVDAPPFEDGAAAYPNLRYRLPDEIEELVDLLAGEALLHAEWHHWLGHDPSLRGLCDRLGLAYDVHVHDYALFCARIALVGAAGRYCGEPDVEGCVACVAKAGSNLGEAIRPAALRARSARELACARAVIVPSADAARRVARHFPSVRPRVQPWEDDAAIFKHDRPHAGPAARARIGVIGAIGVEKGYEILLACVRDARARALPLDFVVIGHTPDDDALLEAGCLDVTGAYGEEEAVALVRAQRCALAFLPSIWPETWCFALGLAWRAGLACAVFDIGAQAERVRRTGRGAVLPLGLPPAAINDMLCRSTASHSPSVAPATESLQMAQ